MRFLIADTFTRSVARLDEKARAAVKRAAFDFQTNPASPGLRLHRLVHARDRGFWSLRVNGDLRIVVHRTDADVVLCYADHHDKAYAWAEHRKLEGPPSTGAAEIVEIVERTREVAPHGVSERGSTAPEACAAGVPDGPAAPITGAPAAQRRLRVRRRAEAPLSTRAPAGGPGAGRDAPLAQLLRLARRSGGTAGARLAFPDSPACENPIPAAAPLAPSLAGASGRPTSPPSDPGTPPPDPMPVRWVAETAMAAVLAGLAAWLAQGLRAGEASPAAIVGFATGLVSAIVVGLSGLARRRLMAGEVRAALAEASRVRDALRAGDLEARAELDQVAPELRPLLTCVNETVEAFAVPFERTTAALASLSRGDLPERLGESSGGEFDRQRDAVNALLDFVQLRAEDIRAILD